MVTQILNFGMPAQIDVRTVGYDRATTCASPRSSRKRIAAIPGIADAHLQQEVDAPEFYTRSTAPAPQFGLTPTGRHQSQHQPELVRAGVAEFLDRSEATGIPYYLAVQTPEYRELAQRQKYAGRPPHVAGGDRRAGPAEQRRDASSASRFRPTQPDQHPAGLRRLCQRAGPRSRQRLAADINKIVAELQKQLARQHDRGRRPDREHERRLPRLGHRPAVRRGVRLSADGGELSELRRSVRR
jgi:hypothetical protein